MRTVAFYVLLECRLWLQHALLLCLHLHAKELNLFLLSFTVCLLYSLLSFLLSHYLLSCFVASKLLLGIKQDYLKSTIKIMFYYICYYN